MLTAYDGKSITYDAIGNPAVWHNSTGDWNLSWANGRQLIGATKGSHIVSYTYDLAGIRNSKTVDGVTYNYITQNGQVVRQTWTSGGENHVMDFIYDNTGKPYAVKYDNQIFYYVLNLQGDVIAIITHWGESYGSYTYDAWGNVISQSGSIASLNPIRYRGYYYDTETGLYYLGSRYYDPQVKRFVNADGAAFATVNPYSNGLTDKNYFAYCNNSPVMQKDDGGELGHIAVAAIVGGVLGGVSAAINGGGVADVLSSAAVGAATGAIGASGLGFVAQALTSGVVSGVGKAATIVCNSGFKGLKDANNQAEIVKTAGFGMADSVLGAATSFKFSELDVTAAKNVRDIGKKKIIQSLYASGRGANKLLKYGQRTFRRGVNMIYRARRNASIVGSITGFVSSLWRRGKV